MSLEGTETEQVRSWMLEAGIDLNRCPGFDYDGYLITTRYYAYNEMGGPYLDQDMEPVMEDYVREFPAKNAPAVVKQVMGNA